MGSDSDLPLIDLAARYEIEGELGQGGMGQVFEALDPELKPRVAVKSLLAKAASVPEVGVEVAMNGGTSDFAIFRDAGVPFIMFFGSDTSRIHTERDILEFVQPEMLGGPAATAAVLLRPQEFADLIANK